MLLTRFIWIGQLMAGGENFDFTGCRIWQKKAGSLSVQILII